MILQDEGKDTDGELSDDCQDASDLIPQHRNELEKNVEKV